MTRRAVFALVALAAIHALLALWFSSLTPYRASGRAGAAAMVDIGAPDERQHANYVQRLLDGRGLPWLDVERMRRDPVYRQEQYESHQPPLYYVLEAGWCRLVGVPDLTDPAAGGRARALNALIGAGGVVGVFFAAWWGFRRLDLAFAAALFPALLPMSVALSGALGNDPLLIALISWTVALCARAVRGGWTFPLAAGAGLLAGAAFLDKTSGLAVLPAVLAAAWLATPRAGWRQAALAAAIFLACAAPLLARNESRYGDPLATNVFNAAFADTAQRSTIVDMLAAQGVRDPEYAYWTEWVGWWTARSFVGVFGYMTVWLNETGHAAGGEDALYRVAIVILGLLGVGWVLSLRQPWAREARAVTIVNGLLALTVLALFIRFDAQFFQAQGRYLYPALAALSIGFGSGIVYHSRARPIAGIVCAACALLLLDLYAGTCLAPAYQSMSPVPAPGYGANLGGVQ